MIDSAEAWLYRFDRKDSFTKHSVDEYQNVKTATVTDFNRYKRYVIFVFDPKGNVIRNDFQGVDLAVKKKDTGATIALVAAGIGVIFGLTALALHSLASDWTYTN
jgi:precorrin-3B methylase